MDPNETLSPADAEAALRDLAQAFLPALLDGLESAGQGQPSSDDAPDPELRYRLLLDQIPAVVFMAPLDHGIGQSYVSRSIEHILGYTQEEWLEDPLRWYQRIHPEDRDRWSSEAANLLVSGGPLRSVYRVLARDGRVIWFQCDAKMVRRDDGRPWFIHGIGFDITELKHAEATMREARDLAEAANRAKSQFLANMSHEIRTPMNGIMGMTELALGAPLTAEVRDCLQTIKFSSEALLSVVDDILDFSKIEAHKLGLVNAPFDAVECVNGVIRVLALAARSKGVRLVLETSLPLPTIVGDAVRLRQILLNLASNAIKFTDHGEVRVALSIDEQTEDSAVLHFLVRDTGIGIPADKQQMIFEAFSQADLSASRKYGGAGLGLTISARLVEMMGGRIWVHSEPGGGSEFHFTVRMGIVEGNHTAVQAAGAGARFEPPPAPVAPPRPQAAPAAKDCRLRVLLAEDNLVNQKVATRLLEKSGYEVTVAGNGLEALEALETAGWQSFDVVLMDVQMPDMDGFAATDAIRLHERAHGGHLPIVALTAHAMAGDRERCLDAGMDGYVAKPIQLASVRAEIEAVLRLG